VDGSGLLVLEDDRRRAVDRVLDGFFGGAKVRAAAFGEAYVRLWDILEESTIGGKRFRPRMVSAVYDALGGTDIDAAAHVGAAFELLHTALVVHDDVIDGDHIRRGVPNVAGRYRDRAVDSGLSDRLAALAGTTAAIIAGDLALFSAHRLIDRTGLPQDVRLRLLDLMDDAVFASAAGELIDVDFSLSESIPHVDEILEMERAKTAVYSFETPLQAGAILAGADEGLVALLGAMGREVGIAFQVVDDILGVFGTEEQTGKTTSGDLREGKRTVLVAYAATRPEWARVASDFGDPDLDEAGAERIRAVLADTGALAFARDVARRHADRALELLSDPDVPDALREALRPVASAVLERVR